VSLLLRSFLWRDRWILLWFVLGVTLLYWAQAPSVDGLYTTQAAFDEAALMMERNAAFIAMAGPARALNTVGGQVAWQATAFGAVVVGLMSMVLVGRHTRAEEESGRDELLRAGVLSRTQPMTAAVVVVTVANVLVAAGVTASLVAYGLAVEGALVLGVGLMWSGLCFGAVALLAAQLTSSVRAAYGLTGAVIGVSYAVRAVGDVTGGRLSWLSPIGWYQAMHAYSGDRWWPVLLLVTATTGLGSAAYVLFARRDFGSGVFADRPGPARAGEALNSSWGLAWRQQRGIVGGWALGLLLGGLAYGSIGQDVEAMLGDSAIAEQMLGIRPEDVVDSFYASSAMMMAVIAAAFAISSALRPRTEEDQGRLEPLLATGLPRTRWLLSHAVLTLGGTTLLLLLSGLGMGLGYGLVTGDWSRVGSLTAASLVFLPATVLLGAVGRLLHGWLPRRASLAWVALVFCAVVLFFAELLRFPDWLSDLSPYTHVGLFPATGIGWRGVVVLSGLAALFSALGFLGFRRRDVAAQ
jgi:ABC-2 type transport system permease protein